MNNIFENLECEKVSDKKGCVVKLITSYWGSGGEIHQKKSIRILKRKSDSDNVLSCDIENLDIGDIFERIVNLDKCCDGVYKLIDINHYRDWETGYIEDWEYKLVKYEEKQ